MGNGLQAYENEEQQGNATVSYSITIFHYQNYEDREVPTGVDIGDPCSHTSIMEGRLLPGCEWERRVQN